ncbi:hypothetical protein ID866_10260 [Astraeus odoratus]|nr:hypothetical protein ID866_10260 [Astraeus odoratus]
MASFPLNPDRRELPAGWIQQYNPDPPAAPPPDNSYNRSPYPGGPSTSQPAAYGGGYGHGYQPSYDPRNNAPQGGYGGPPPGLVWELGRTTLSTITSKRARHGNCVASGTGGAGLVGGALLMDAIEDHDEHERAEGFDQGYDQGYDQGFDQGFDGGDFGGGDW